MHQIRKLVGFVSVWFCCSLAASAATSDTLYINRGKLSNIEYGTMTVLNFNSSQEFELTPAMLELPIGEILELTIVNNDTASHTLQWSGADLAAIDLLAGAKKSISLSFQASAILQLSDASAQNLYQGLHTLIVFKPASFQGKSHFWSLREHNVALNKYWEDEVAAAKNNYQAEYFTINNRSYPHVINDPNVYIKASVGDTLLVYVTNLGWMNHNLHFHGYHVKILTDTAHPLYAGREKDSLPVRSGAVVVLQIIPNQPGVFPIHNHNLGATVGTNRYNNQLGVTICGSESTDPGDNIYPFGMLTEIEITKP